MHYIVKSITQPFTVTRLGRCMANVGDTVFVADEALGRKLIERGCLHDPFEVKAEPIVAEKVVPIAVQEANAIMDKLVLDEWAESEHGIKLRRNKSLPNMKMDFAKEFEAKMQKIELSNKALVTGAIENK